MSNKQICIGYCRAHMEARGLSQYFNLSDFESAWRKHRGATANPYNFGLTAADIIILNAKPLPNDSANER